LLKKERQDNYAECGFLGGRGRSPPLPEGLLLADSRRRRSGFGRVPPTKPPHTPLFNQTPPHNHTPHHTSQTPFPLTKKKKQNSTQTPNSLPKHSQKKPPHTHPPLTLSTPHPQKTTQQPNPLRKTKPKKTKNTPPPNLPKHPQPTHPPPQPQSSLPYIQLFTASSKLRRSSVPPFSSFLTCFAARASN